MNYLAVFLHPEDNISYKKIYIFFLFGRMAPDFNMAHWPFDDFYNSKSQKDYKLYLAVLPLRLKVSLEWEGGVSRFCFCPKPSQNC